MGNNLSQNKISLLPINFKEIKRKENLILGQIRILQNNHDGFNYILLQKVYASQFQYQKNLKKLRSRQKMGKMQKKYYPNEFIIQILQLRTQQITQVCGKSYKILIFIKAFDSDLREQFNDKLYKKQNFTEIQLFQLIYKIVNCLIQLYDHQITPFHLSMQSIILRNKNYKILDNDLTNVMRPIDTLRYKSQLNKGIYMAPQILQIMSQNFDQIIITNSKSDIFTLGMIILSLVSMQQLDSLYDYNHMKINTRKMYMNIQKSNYSIFFKQVLTQMLQIDQNKRIGLLRLKQKLKNSQLNLQKILLNAQQSQQKPLTDRFIVLGSNKMKRFQSIDVTSDNFINSLNSYQPYNFQNKKSIQVQNYSFSQNQQNNSFKKLIELNNSKSYIVIPSLNYQPIYKPTTAQYNYSFIKEKNNQKFSKVQIPNLDFSENNKSRNSIKNGFNEQRNNSKFREQNKLKFENKHLNQKQIRNNQLKQTFQLNTQLYQSIKNKNLETPPRFNNINNISTIKEEQSHLKEYQNTLKMQKNKWNSPKNSQTPIKEMQLLQTQRKQFSKIKQRVFGRHDFSNGAVYEGQFNQQNEFQGNGVLYYPSGKIFYSGNWVKNMFHGFGILNNVEMQIPNKFQINYKNFNTNENSDWLQYEGQFFQDKKNGFGTLLFHNGDKFSGCFNNDLIQGFGSFYKKGSNKPISGVWSANILQET